MNAARGGPHELLPGDGSALLFPSFLSIEESGWVLDTLLAQVPWEITRIPMFGREVTEPRLSAWIADPGVAYRYSGRDRIVHEWSPVLTDLRDRARDVADSAFNGVLANLYRDGHDHMGWHADDERSLGTDPIIASVSLGADRRFDFRHRTTGEIVSTVLPHGSLLVMSGPVQRCWKHRIPKAPKVSAQRVNLTYRLLR
ncbi:MAG: alpha-ketoglutarate-dependent dioxygenase AlkB family protein [Ilumatobacteraceae bacterium]